MKAALVILACGLRRCYRHGNERVDNIGLTGRGPQFDSVSVASDEISDTDSLGSLVAVKSHANLSRFTLRGFFPLLNAVEIFKFFFHPAFKYTAIIFLLCSCNPLKHYQKVVADPFRNAAERNLLSRACVQEFPAINDTPKVVFTGVDSSDYNAVNHAYNVLLDSLIAHYERESTDTAGALTAPTGKRDSLRIIRNFLRVYKPPAVIRTEVKEVQVRNTAIENQLQTAVDNCRRENEGLRIQKEEAVNLRKKSRTNLTWLYIVAGLLLAGNLFQLFAKRRVV